MRAAYLVDSRVRARSAFSEFPSETTGKGPEIINVQPDTDWMSSFPEEQAKPNLFAVVPRELVPSPTAINAPAVPVPFEFAYRELSTRYRSHAVALAIIVTLIVISSIIIRDWVTTPRASAIVNSPVPAVANAQEPAAIAPPAPPAVPPVAALATKPREVTATKANTPASRPPARPAAPSVSSAKSTKSTGGLPVRNPTAPITSPIPVKTLAPPPTAPPPAGVTLPIADGSGSMALATAPNVPASVPAAPAKESPTTSPAPSAAPPPPTAARDAAAVGVRSVIDRYRAAFNSLNVAGISSFWPTVNERALAKAFEQLQAQRFDFDDCQIDVTGQFARALCTGTANFVTKVGSKAPHLQSRLWTFHLSRAASGWIIDRVESR